MGTGSLGCPPRLSHCSSSMLLYAHRDHKDYWGQEPRTSTSSFTQLRSSAVAGWCTGYTVCLPPPHSHPLLLRCSTEKGLGRYAQKVIATVAVVVCSFLQCKLVCLFLNSCCRENFAWAKQDTLFWCGLYLRGNAGVFSRVIWRSGKPTD